MYPTGREKQGGSILIFSVVAIVLIALAAGGVYYVRNQSPETGPIASDTNDNGQVEGPDRDNVPAEELGDDDYETVESEAPRDNEVEQTLPGAIGDDLTGEDIGDDDDVSVVPVEIPETGAGQTLTTMIVLAGVTYAFSRYYQTRLAKL